LTHKNVNIEKAFILLEDTKNGKRRVLPLTDYPLALMCQHMKNRRVDT